MRDEVVLAYAVHWLASGDEVGELVGEFVLTLHQPVSQLVVTCYPAHTTERVSVMTRESPQFHRAAVPRQVMGVS